MRAAIAAGALLAVACAEPAPPPPPGWAWAGAELRPDNPRSTDLFRFDAGDVVESLASPSGNFRVHYARQGRHAVSAADTDASGVPDAVERVARLYDEALAFYRARGFRGPVSDGALADNGGDAAFDVYLVDFNRAADGAYRRETCRQDAPSICSGYMVQENDFAGYGYPSVPIAERIVGSHELFHAVQAAYDADQGSILAEGTAEWATEQFDSSLGDFESQIRGYFSNADRSLDKPLPGPVDPFSYGSAIFFQFLTESIGPEVVRELIEATEDGAGGVPDPQWYALFPAFLAARGTSFEEAFLRFIDWNLHTGSAAAAGFGYASARAYPVIERLAVRAPVEEEALRVFYASTQVYTVTPDGRDTLDVALVADDLEGVVLMTAPVTGGRPAAPADRAGAPWRASYAMAGVDAVLAAIVNVNTAGNSKRPTLCAGSPQEVEACVARHSGAGADAGVAAEDAASSPDAAAPMADAGGEADAGVIAAEDAAAAADAAPVLEESSSCAGVRGQGTLAAWSAAVALLALRRRGP